VSPIEGISDRIRIPRLGHIRLGLPKGKGPGQATPYFELRDEDGCGPIKAKYGDKPTRLVVMFPSNRLEDFAQQYKKRYSASMGWTCIGTGSQILRKRIDKATGDFANSETKEWVIVEGGVCDGDECPEFLSQRCRNCMHLMVALPDIPGFGVWQINTSSFHNMVAVNNFARFMKSVTGRCTDIPIVMTRQAKEVTPGGRKKTVYVLDFNITESLVEILSKTRSLPAPRTFLLEADTDSAPDDLYGEQVEEAPVVSVATIPAPVAEKATAAPVEPVPSELWRQFLQHALEMGYGLDGVLRVIPKALDSRFATDTFTFSGFMAALVADKAKSAPATAEPEKKRGRPAKAKEEPAPASTPATAPVSTPPSEAKAPPAPTTPAFSAQFDALKAKAKAMGFDKQQFVTIVANWSKLCQATDQALFDAANKALDDAKAKAGAAPSESELSF